MRRAGLLAALVLAWCLMWGSARPADVLGGLLAATVVQGFVPGDALPGVRLPRPVAAARFIARFAVDLVAASATVAVQVFWRRGRLRPRVMTVQLSSRDAGVLTIVGNAVTLTPGTLTLDVDPASGTLLIHVLHTRDGREVHEAAARYERLVSAMLGAQRPGA